VCSRYSARISSGTSTILAQIFRNFPQSLQVNASIRTKTASFQLLSNSSIVPLSDYTSIVSAMTVSINNVRKKLTSLYAGKALFPTSKGTLRKAKLTVRDKLMETNISDRRSQWPRGLRHELSSSARTLGSWVRIPRMAWMSVCVYPVCR
jgi:hypothetical protein